MGIIALGSAIISITIKILKPIIPINANTEESLSLLKIQRSNIKESNAII
jgi:hypothetical protein